MCVSYEEDKCYVFSIQKESMVPWKCEEKWEALYASSQGTEQAPVGELVSLSGNVIYAGFVKENELVVMTSDGLTLYFQFQHIGDHEYMSGIIVRKKIPDPNFWGKVGNVPQYGKEMRNKELGSYLQKKVNPAEPDELIFVKDNEFGIMPNALQPTHFVKADGNYFQPGFKLQEFKYDELKKVLVETTTQTHVFNCCTTAIENKINNENEKWEVSKIFNGGVRVSLSSSTYNLCPKKAW